ncbi:exonuclease domain-containing protein [Conexibacter sp. SYSU D00693]|uniref:exonuclease domain-containing protein n=1 Tax=Conexibacter sp. SYSU D00693 TaxID=2812560 RepID=UPI00196A5A00|nr:exonuclease domain-containing protein [Conexibacter sp. SYSU D00693]
MSLLDHPLATAEFLALDTETNGKAGDACEVTEVGAVLVGGGELHDRWETLVPVRAPLGRGIQRFTGITQDMVDEAPPAEVTLPELAELLEGRVLVAHSASFDKRVLAQAFERAGLAWPDPPSLCTVALARRLHPLARQRKLGPLAESLGIDVGVTHRALADAETCARVFCALFPRLCGNAATVGEALALLRAARPGGRRTRRTDGGGSLRGTRKRKPDMSHLPDEPGVYVFRNAEGQPLYVGKSISVRTRAKAHFAPSSPDTSWIAQVEMAEGRPTASELGALLLEEQLIRELRPPGNLRGRDRNEDRWVFLRCRLDIPFPVLEVASEPAAGLGVSVGPLLGRHAAGELVEQLQSLFGLRHCGRKLQRREHPSAYGQMGRCLSPCLGDLDPNAYRRRLDQALALFSGPRAGKPAVLAHLDREMRAAAEAHQFERAAWLRRRRVRLAELLDRVGGTAEAAHAHPRLVLAAHPEAPRADLLWLVGGRVADWGEVAGPDEAWERTQTALRGHDGRPVALTAEQARQARVATTWLAANEVHELALEPRPDRATFDRWLRAAMPKDLRPAARTTGKRAAPVRVPASGDAAAAAA